MLQRAVREDRRQLGNRQGLDRHRIKVVWPICEAMEQWAVAMAENLRSSRIAGHLLINPTFENALAGTIVCAALRLTGMINEERMSVYVRLGIRLLYKGLKSREMEKKRGMSNSLSTVLTCISRFPPSAASSLLRSSTSFPFTHLDRAPANNDGHIC